MGRLARSLIKTFRDESADIAEAAEQLSAGIPDEMPSPQELIAEGYDPQHILYIAAQNLAGMFSGAMIELDEFAEYARAYAAAESEYIPSSPPISPITQSFFFTWALFDLRFGPDRETIGDCLVELLQAMEMPEEMLGTLEKYNRSRMGIFEHCGVQRGKIRLRELVTGDEMLCHSTSGYSGRNGELWYARLCPPVSNEFDYYVSVTTPYILTGASAEDWTAFLNKQLLGADDKRQSLYELLKYGTEQVRWMEFVFQAYHHYQYDAIFLAGIPDVPASLPHSAENSGLDDNEMDVDDEDDDSSTEDVADPVLRLKFTEVQRMAIAEMFPDLTSRLHLSLKNARVVMLRQSELKRVVQAARKELDKTKGPRRTALKKIIGISEPSRSEKLTPVARVYQFKITLVHSDPPIWRRIQVCDCTLADLHHYIQGAMGWMDSHLHEFNVAGQRYSTPPPMDVDFDFDAIDAVDATKVKLSQLIGDAKRFRCRYTYDFGDGWEHVVELEKVGAIETKVRYPRCIEGERACPPEDCGGIFGFYEFVEAMSDRKHPEHEDMMDWYGRRFKPEEFDSQKATRRMQ